MLDDERGRAEDRSSRVTLWAIGVLSGVLIVLVVLIVLSGRNLRSYENQSGSMLPTLKVGRSFEVDLGARFPERGRIIVFHGPQGISATNMRCAAAGQGLRTPRPCGMAGAGPSAQTFVKRVVGLPGDRIALVDGVLIRDGLRVNEPYARGCTDAALCTFSRAITIPRGEYFVLGDNRGSSDDSRFWGPIQRSWIVGTLVQCHFLRVFCSPVR